MHESWYFLSQMTSFEVKRFMSVFCKRRGADDFFLMVNLPAVSVFTFYLFWVKVPLAQHRAALLCSKMELQIPHEIEWLTFFLRFCDSFIHFTKGTFLFITYIPRGKDTKGLVLVYNLLTTELQKVFYLPLFYCKDLSQLNYLLDMNLFRLNHN